MKMQERKVREEGRPRDFCTGSLKPKLHPVFQGNMSLTLHYFKIFTKYSPLHFQNMQKYHTRLLNHTSTARTLLQTWKTTRHTHKAWERSNLSGSTTQPTTNRDGNGAGRGRVSLSHTHSRKKKFIPIPIPKPNGYQTFVPSPSPPGNGCNLIPIPIPVFLLL